MKFILVLLMAFCFVPVTVAQATEITCGTTLTEDIVLHTNLDCSESDSNGLVIGANDIKIDLNGYTIAGDVSAQAGAGVLNDGHTGITIKNGAIYGFGTAILLIHSGDIAIDHLTLAHQAWESIAIGESTDVRIEDVQISLDYESPGIETIGVVLFRVEDAKLQNLNIEGSFYGVQSLESEDVKVTESSFTDISHVGVRMVMNHDSVVENNRIVGTGFINCFSAIDIVGPGPSNHIKVNANVLAECSHGVFVGGFPDDPPRTNISIRNNQIRLTANGIVIFETQDSDIFGNRLHFNETGIVLLESSFNNRIFGNTSTGNVVSDIDHDESSVPNNWFDNTCVVSPLGDIDCP